MFKKSVHTSQDKQCNIFMQKTSIHTWEYWMQEVPAFLEFFKGSFDLMWKHIIYEIVFNIFHLAYFFFHWQIMRSNQLPSSQQRLTAINPQQSVFLAMVLESDIPFWVFFWLVDLEKNKSFPPIQTDHNGHGYNLGMGSFVILLYLLDLCVFGRGFWWIV